MGRPALHGSHGLASTPLLRQVGCIRALTRTSQGSTALLSSTTAVSWTSVTLSTMHCTLPCSTAHAQTPIVSAACFSILPQHDLMPHSCKHASCATCTLRKFGTKACLQSKLEEGIIALPSEIVGAAERRLHVGNAGASVQRAHPAIDQPAGQPARREGARCQEDKLELLRVGDDPPVQAALL